MSSFYEREEPEAGESYVNQIKMPMAGLEPARGVNHTRF